MRQRPDYCPDDLSEGTPCPRCGATEDGNDQVRGVCQARFSGPEPKPLVRVVLIDKRTGQIV